MARRIPDRDRLAIWMSDIRLTLAGPADRPDLERLAALDERPVPAPPCLVARIERIRPDQQETALPRLAFAR